jgi:hypothetical protein
VLHIVEPVWSLDRIHETGDLFWRRDSSKVKFRCEVQVLEFERDPYEYNNWPRGGQRRCYGDDTSNPIVVIATCVGAIVITILLPWFMAGESKIVEVW